MMRALRQSGLGQIIMAGIVFAIIAVFVLEFRTNSGMQTGSLTRECAVRVDGVCVAPKDYMAEYGLVVPRQVTPKQVKQFELRKHVMDGVIERELLVAEAERLGLAIDDEDVKADLRLGHARVSLPAAEALRLGSMLDLVTVDETGIARDMIRELPIVDPKTGGVDDDLYSRVVRSTTGRSPKEFLKMQERELLAARLRDLVRARVRVSEEEAFDAYAREKSEAVVRTLHSDAEWFARWVADASDASVDRWITDHKEPVDAAWKDAAARFKADCTLVSEIVLPITSDASEAQKTLLQEKIERARASLDGGVPFGVVARQVSQGDQSITGGGIGCLTAEGYGEGGEELVKAVASLSAGATSAPIATKRGLHLIHVEGKLAAANVETVGRRAVARPLAARAMGEIAAKEFAGKVLTAVKGGARLDDTVTSLLAELGKTAPAFAPPPGVAAKTSETEGAPASADPAPLADPKAPKAEVSAPFGLDGQPVPGLYGGPSLSRIAFELAKADDVHAEAIVVPGGFIVLQLKEKTMATREDFAKTKGEVMGRLEIGKRADALTRYVARLRQAKQDKIEINERMLEEPKAASSE